MCYAGPRHKLIVKAFLFCGIFSSLLFFISGCKFKPETDAITTLDEFYKKRPLAFTGAKGYGKFSLGGRYGKVVYVTNLNNAGEGSLRYALEDVQGPRTILFAISGCIYLRENITVSEPYVTIAGQSAPHPGICVKGGGLVIKTHDVIVRYINIRRGDVIGASGHLSDGIAINRSQNVIIDHVSISWTLDESLQVWYEGSKNITVQHSLMAEPLNLPLLRPDEGHPHGYGPLIGPETKKVSLLNNLIAYATRRSPRISNAQFIEVKNNVIFGYRGSATHIVDSAKFMESRFINISGNLYSGGRLSNAINPSSSIPERKIFINDNYYFEKGFISPLKPLRIGDANRGDSSNLHYHESFKDTIRDVGATIPQRDDVDTSIIKSIIAHKISFPDCVSDVDSGEKIVPSYTCKSPSSLGSWPYYEENFSSSDFDLDGIPDELEATLSLNPFVYDSDSVCSSQTGPLSCLEYYLNELLISGVQLNSTD